MDTLTHSLVGLTASKAGLEKLSPGASVACLLTANAPDVDFISGIFGDRWTLLQHHRGITHSILGTLLLALLIPSLFWLGDSVISGWRRRARTIRFRGLLLAALIVSATHPLMDWTNNYGLRPLLPWSGRWYYGDLVFIVDPVLWMVLGATAFLLTSRSKLQLSLWSVLASTLTVLMLYAGVIRGALSHPAIALVLWISMLGVLLLCRKSGYLRQRAGKVALVGFGLVFGYWAGLAFLHSSALDKAGTEANIVTASTGEKVTKLAAMPTLANPIHWLCVVETERSLYRFDLFLQEQPGQVHNLARFAKPTPAETRVIALAERDRRAKILLGFARFPIWRLVDHDCLTETLVQLADLRYTEPGRKRGNFSVEIPVECPKQP